MRLIQVATAVVSFASLAFALPSPAEEFEYQVVQVFERGDPLTAEDALVAREQGVDTAEMFKHSILQRRGEEPVIIWVHNSFNESDTAPEAGPEAEPDSGLTERAMRTQVIGTWARGTLHQEVCRDVTWWSDNGPNAPCTGGIKAIRDWARQNPGFFRMGYTDTNWRSLIAGGSNTGCNGAFRSRRLYSSSGELATITIGNVDLHNVIQNNLNSHARVYNGRERLRAYGNMNCGNYQTPLMYRIANWDSNL